MTHYLRLGYIVPRLVLLAALYGVAEYGCGWGLRWALTTQGQTAVGAKVEVRDAEVSLLETRAVVTGVRVANPRRPMENLVEADRIELDFESDSLLRRRAIADVGTVRGLRFGTPRETSGALDPTQQEPTSDAPSWIPAGAKQAAKQAADRWLADMEKDLSTEVDDFESVRLARELAATWPGRFDSLAAEARELRTEVESLRDTAKEARANPLRHADFLTTAPQRLADLRQRLAGLHERVASLPADVALDKQRVEAARRADEERVRARLQVDQLDPQSLTSLLLGDRVTSSVRDLVGWVRWTRSMIPAGKPEGNTVERDRGVDVLFAGLSPRPELLVRRLDVSGTARVADGPIELTGVVTDFTTSPALHGQPVRAHFTSTGSLPLEVRATIDRTGDTPIDEVLVDCPAIAVSSARLGSSDRFALEMPASTASLNVSVRIEGERLAGDIQLVQDRVALAASVGEGASPLVRRLASAVGEQVASVAKPATRVTLSGTLDDPQVQLWSTLGPAIAESLENAAVAIARSEAQTRLAGLQERVAGELASLDGLVDRATSRLAEELNAPEAEVQQLASRLLGGAIGRGSVSFEQLGKRLPEAGKLFK